MALLETEWTGGQGLVYYGTTLLFCDSWSVNEKMDVIDITNINIYRTAGFPNGLPPKDNDPDLPYDKKDDALNKYEKKQAQYGAGRVYQEGNLRVANIQCSGLCASYDPLVAKNFMPRIGNHVYMQFTNNLDSEKTLFNFPDCIVMDVTYELTVRGYQRWNFTAITTLNYKEDVNVAKTDFDIFPGKKPQ